MYLIYSVLHSIIAVPIAYVVFFLSLSLAASPMGQNFASEAITEKIIIATEYGTFFIGAVLLYVTVHQHNNQKRAIVLNAPELSHKLAFHLKKTALSVDFWLCSLIYTVPVSAMPEVKNALTLPFYVTSAIILPILLVCEALQRKHWAIAFLVDSNRFNFESAEDYVEHTASGFVRKAVNVACISAAINIVPIVVPFIAMCVPMFRLLFSASGDILPISLFIVFALISLRALGCALKRRKILKALKKVCAENHFEFENRTKLFRGLFYASNKADVVIKNGSETYSAMFLPIPTKLSTVFFFANGYYRFITVILRLTVKLPKHKAAFEADGEKYIVFTKAPAEATVISDGKASTVDNGDSIFGMKAYTGKAFVNMIGRKIINGKT